MKAIYEYPLRINDIRHRKFQFSPIVFYQCTVCLKGAGVDPANVLALAHLAGDDIVELGAGLLAPRPADLPLGALAVHGFEVREGGAGVVKEPGLLQRASLPCHVGPPVPGQQKNIYFCSLKGQCHEILDLYFFG